MSGPEHFSIDDALTAAERKRRSLWVIAVHSAFAACSLVLPAERDRLTMIEAAAVSWVATVAAAAVFRAQGPSRLYRIIDACDQLMTPCALLAAIYASPRASVPLWLVMCVRSFGYLPSRPYKERAERVGLVVSHGMLITAFISSGEVSHAVAAVALLLVQLIDLDVSAKLALQELQLAVERDALQRQLEAQTVRSDKDRIARELHDGLGADLVAMLMSLRAEPELANLATRVETTLTELRGVVWALRDNRGTLGELDKLLCVRVRATTPQLSVSSTCALGDRLALVEASSALPTINALPALAAQLAQVAPLSHLTIGLGAVPRLAVTLTALVEPAHVQSASAAISNLSAIDETAAQLATANVELRVTCAIAKLSADGRSLSAQPNERQPQAPGAPSVAPPSTI